MTTADRFTFIHTPLSEEFKDLLLSGNPGISISDRSLLTALVTGAIALDPALAPAGLSDSQWWRDVAARASSFSQWRDILAVPGVSVHGVGPALTARLDAIVTAGRF